MNIVLYHVDNISSVDTPYFSNITAQQQYFDSKIIKEIETSFYPPYYHNEIKFDDSDVDVNTGVNYLSLTYKNKVYYYFVSGIDYISSGVVKLIIDMDVIQTFMFNISISSGIINRQHIKRWNGTKRILGSEYDLINRDYIRENVSKGNLLLSKINTYQKMNDIYSTVDTDETIVNDQTMYVLLFKCSKRLGGVDINKINTSFGETSHSAGFIDMSTYYMVPVGNTMDRDMEYDYYSLSDGEYQTDGKADIDAMIKELALSGFISNIYVVPLNVFKGDFHLLGRSLYFDTKVPLYDGVYGHDGSTRYLYYMHNNIKFVMLNYVPTKIISKSFSLGFTKNSVRRSWKEEPSLLDNNYIKITFGDEITYSTFDLYYSDIDLFKWDYYVSIENFERIYSLVSYNYIINQEGKYTGLIYDDWTNSTVSCNPYTLTTITDSWNTWKENNKFTIPMAYVGAAANTALIASDIKGGMFGVQQDKNAILVNMLLGNRSEKKVAYSRMKEYESQRGQVYNEAGSMADKFTNIATNQYNSLLAPNTFKHGGNFITAVMDKSARLSLKTYIVDDIEYCAMYYRLFGNMIKKPIYNISNIFSYVQVREYYNYFELVNAEVHLINHIESEDIIDNIKARLSSGIRLWNVNKRFDLEYIKIGDYSINNIESNIIPPII